MADRHPSDPANPEIDPVAFAIERVRMLLQWIDEHRSSFEAYSESRPEDARRELAYLADATAQAKKYADRLRELLLAGAAIDKNKKLPR